MEAAPIRLPARYSGLFRPYRVFLAITRHSSKGNWWFDYPWRGISLLGYCPNSWHWALPLHLPVFSLYFYIVRAGLWAFYRHYYNSSSPEYVPTVWMAVLDAAMSEVKLMLAALSFFFIQLGEVYQPQPNSLSRVPHPESFFAPASLKSKHRLLLLYWKYEY